VATDLSEASWNVAYREREDLVPFGSAGLALYAMALKFGYDDLPTIGADAVVDGPDDKGCDVVYLDREQRMAVVAQSYRAITPKQAASDSKAATLRQGISYLLEVNLSAVPERLRASATALRTALLEGEIETVYVWFVHNCPHSANVTKEVDAVEQSVKSVLSARYNDHSVRVFAEEISSETLEKLYTDTSTPILVNESFSLTSDSVLQFEEGDWNCVVIPLQISKLQQWYQKYSTDLFSANVRDFLGVKAGDSNINYQMQKSLAEKPQNFFVYNNGLTILTHRVNVQPSSADEKQQYTVDLYGLSIVNGAQTTGTIGTSKSLPPSNAYVLARFISTDKEELVGDVVRFNNSQNAVTASDFRSTDSHQRRLVEEMKAIPDAEYDGGRRGGVSAAIKRRPKLLPSYSVGQALAAFHGSPAVAYNEKSAIWSRDALYSRYFNDHLTAAHVVFAYSLLRAIENEKNLLRAQEGGPLTETDRAKLTFYRKRGSVFLLAGAAGECLETIVGAPISNKFKVSLGNQMSPDKAIALWKPVVTALSGLHSYLEKALNDGLKNQETVGETLKSFSQLVASLREPYQPFFEPLKNEIEL